MDHIQTKEVEELQRRWRGGPCDHPVLAKEYSFGAAIGDYTCTICGKCKWGRDWPEQERENQKQGL